MLLKQRPSRIYVTSNPPILTASLVAFYCKLSKASFIYHVQDIHPEATRIAVGMSNWLFEILRRIDTSVLNSANTVITLTQSMRQTLVGRGCMSKIVLVDNPSIDLNLRTDCRIHGVAFVGNAGRLQRMDEIIDEIDLYLSSGGTLTFKFAGGGVYSSDLEALARKHVNFHYCGKVSAAEAFHISSSFSWALLPITPDALHYAYPSKLASYLASGARIICYTDASSDLGIFIRDNSLGVIVGIDRGSLCGKFFELEHATIESEFKPPKFYPLPEEFGTRLGSLVRGDRGR